MQATKVQPISLKPQEAAFAVSLNNVQLCCVPLDSSSRDHEFTSGETAFH